MLSQPVLGNPREAKAAFAPFLKVGTPKLLPWGQREGEGPLGVAAALGNRR